MKKISVWEFNQEATKKGRNCSSYEYKEVIINLTWRKGKRGILVTVNKWVKTKYFCIYQNNFNSGTFPDILQFMREKIDSFDINQKVVKSVLNQIGK